MDASSAADGKRRIDRSSDVGAAIGLAFLEVLALLVTFAAWFLSGWGLDPASPGTTDPVWGYLGAAGTVGAAALGAAILASRRNASVTAWSQGFMTTVVAVVILGGTAYQQHEDQRNRPLPGPTFSGQVGCRSGGDNSECRGTGG
ncbi:DUF6234 family protein [Streptomyces sp. 8N706]|uniref:DUF6234 family protein n=1 Tax=Streptomyces sp. 8N706 TaxID=3457416 RepID=UPI003FD291A4